MIMRLRPKYNLSLEAQVFYHIAVTPPVKSNSSSWLGRRRSGIINLIRPTSVVQVMCGAKVESFAGVHPACEWVPFLCAMPHAEWVYPSGSGCICIGIQQFIDKFLLHEYRDDSILRLYLVGVVLRVWWWLYKFENMLELHQDCGASRLVGEWHARFTASGVQDSYELVCDECRKDGIP